MTISIKEFLERIKYSAADLYLLVCTEIIIYDSTARIVYIPITTHNNANLNPLGDFRTHIGHFLLWSRHVEIDCSSQELKNALYAEGYQIAPYHSTADYSIYSLREAAGIAAQAV